MKMWHGTNDTVVKEVWGQNTARAFQEVGYNVTYLTDPKAHVLPPKKIVEEFLII